MGVGVEFHAGGADIAEALMDGPFFRGVGLEVRGAEKVLVAFSRGLGIPVGKCTPDGKFSLNTLRCVGACGLAPVATIDDKVYGRLNPSDIRRIISEYEAKE